MFSYVITERIHISIFLLDIQIAIWLFLNLLVTLFDIILKKIES